MQNFLEGNKKIIFDSNHVLAILKELDYILCSLHDIGSYYCDKDENEYEKETTQFIDNSLVCDRLAKIRYILTTQFDSAFSEKELENIESIFETIPYWEKPGDFCDEIWIVQKDQ